MTLQTRTLTAAVVLLLAAGCSSGSNSSTPAGLPAASAPTVPSGATQLKISFKVPGVPKKAPKQSQKRLTKQSLRAPLYVSPSTLSFTVSVNGGTAQTFTCTGTTLTCTATVNATPGADTIGIKLYDAAGGTGAELGSNNAAPCTVTAGTANTCNVTVYGLATAFEVVPRSSGFTGSIGNAAPIITQGALTPLTTQALTYVNATSNQFTIDTLDADGNEITGPGAISAAVTSSGTGITIAPAATPTPAVFTIDATSTTPQTIALSASPAPSADGSTLTASFTVAGQTTPISATADIFVVSTGFVNSFYDTQGTVSTFTAAGVPTTAFYNGVDLTVLSSPQGVAADAAHNIYVADTFDSEVQIFSSAGVPTGSFTTGVGSSPQGIAVDATPNIYVADGGAGTVTKYSSTGTPIPFTTQQITGLSDPDGVAVDGSGNIYVASNGSGTITKYGPTGTPIPLTNPITGLDGPIGVAVDAAGNIYVANFGAGGTDLGNVQEYNSTGTLINTITTGVNEPSGVAVDANTPANIYVSNYGSGLGGFVTVYANAGGSPTNTFLAGPQPFGIAYH